MKIDFHTHFFPESVALKTVRELSSTSGIQPNGDGTIFALKRFMQEDGIDLAVNLPVATRPDQVEGINRKMVGVTGDEKPALICFGSMHPEFGSAERIGDEFRKLSEQGVLGIKMHPEFQKFYPDDPKLITIYENCRKFGLILVLHSGQDFGFPETRATPERLAQVAKIEGLKLVLAHMGGYKMWDEVEKHLLGVRDVFFDTAFTLEMEDWRMKEIILGHGPYKILFGSDFPWARASKIESKIRGLGLGKDFEDWIFSKNAAGLLKLHS